MAGYSQVGKQKIEKQKKSLNIYELLELALCVPSREIELKNKGDKIRIAVIDCGVVIACIVVNSNQSLRKFRDFVDEVIQNDQSAL